MRTEKWNRARELFARVLEFPPDERESFVQSACAGDEALLGDVRALLDAYEGDSFLESPPPLDGAIETLEIGRGFLDTVGPEATLADGSRATVGPEPSATDAARPASIGPYRILGALGKGGMGVVYRGQHVETGALAAIKTVRVASASRLASIRREIHALAQLHHPGIVAVLDHGVEAGMPWYAMELLEGASLATLLRAGAHWRRETAGKGPATHGEAAPPAETAPEAARRPSEARPAEGGDLARTLTLVRQLCAPLAYLHGEGIVHRDLKPDNVVVRPSGLPVLVDFGLASPFAGRDGRELLGALDDPGGTLVYMAPEQFRGDDVDARADLYALGCILYELLVGRPPFVRPSAVEYMWAHLEATPSPPSACVAGLPPGLDELVMRLLAKQPDERIGHAADVARALAQLGGDGWPGAPLPEPRPYLYRPGFAGREAVLARLEPHLAPVEGGGRAFLIGGVSGAGKTRLAVEIGRRAGGAGAPVLVGECPPRQPHGSLVSGARARLLGFNPLGGTPLGALRGPLARLADLCHERGEEAAHRLFGPRGKLLALCEPALAELPGQERYPEPAELPPDAARLRLFEALAATLAAAADANALVLLLDDLQWADELTLGFLDYLVGGRRIAASRLLLVGLFRTDEEPEAIRSLVERGCADEIVLDRLREADVGAVVRDMLGLEAAPAALGGFLARQSEGNPFFVVEYLRAAVSAGLLWRGPDGVWEVGERGGVTTAADYERLGLPGSLVALVERRLGALAPAAATLAGAAAVLGREADLGMLARMTGSPEPAVFDACRTLLRRQIVETTSAGAIRFTHDKLREVAYERLSPSDRTRLHRAAAATIEAGGLGDQPDWSVALANHWELAGEAARARAYYLAAARHARTRFAHRDAERLYRAYLALGDDPSPESVRARVELSDELAMQGCQREQFAELERACDEAAALADPALEGDALARTGSALRLAGRQRDAQPRLERALEIATRTGDLDLEGRVRFVLVLINYDFGRWDEIEPLLDRALSCHRATGNRHEESRALAVLGVIRHCQDRDEEARAALEAALAVKREIGDLAGQLLVLDNLGALVFDAGDFEGGLAHFADGLALAREIGNVPYQGGFLCRIGWTNHYLGRPEAARRAFEEGLAICRESGQRYDLGNGLTGLAVVEADEGAVARSRATFDEAEVALKAAGVQRSEALMLIDRARCERRFGDLDRAEAFRSEAEAFFREVDEQSQRALCLCERGHVEIARGRAPRAMLDEVEAIVVANRIAADSVTGRDVARFVRAVAAFDAGRPLVNGECREDVPRGLLEWLAGGREA
jgi:serine/threonine protein kinase/tetratricopeptide (TPR) repeat protein